MKVHNVSVCISIALALLSSLVPLYPATNIPAGTITTDTTWSLAGSPFVVACGGVTVASGVALTIEAGVVVKFCYASAFLQVNGSLVANGTAAQKIFFTSILDDTVGGDTNGDGSATTPSQAYWDRIRFGPGTTGSISNAV